MAQCSCDEIRAIVDQIVKSYMEVTMETIIEAFQFAIDEVSGKKPSKSKKAGGSHVKGAYRTHMSECLKEVKDEEPDPKQRITVCAARWQQKKKAQEE